MSDQLCPIKNAKLIKAAVYKYRWIDPEMELECLMQEGYVAWIEALKVYDESLGVKFSTFYYKHVYYHLKNMSVKKSRHSVPTVSEGFTNPDAENGVKGFYDITPSPVPLPDEVCESFQLRERSLSKFCELTKTVIRLFESPPIEVYEELTKLDNWKSIHEDSPKVTRKVSLAFIFDFLCLSRPERTKVKAQLKKMQERCL